LMIPIYFFAFDDTHLLLPFWWYPLASSLFMLPIFYFPFNDTHLLFLHLWWYPFILMTPIGSWGNHRQRQDGNFCELCVPQGVLFLHVFGH
jgi:hypothetical protein